MFPWFLVSRFSFLVSRFSFLAPLLLIASSASAVLPYGPGKVDYKDSEFITSYANAGDKYPEVESEGAPAVVWVRGGSKQIEINFYNPSSVAHTGEYLLGRPTFEAITGDYELSVSPGSGTLNFPAHGEAGFTVDLEGLPDHVDKGTLTIPFVVQPVTPGAQVAGLEGYITYDIYLTYAEPTGTQGVAWLDVLDDTCTWAAGMASESDIRRECTLGLYWRPGFIYSGQQQFYTEYPSSFLDQSFLIMDYFGDRYTPGSVIEGDCTDHANYLNVCFDSQGVNASTLILVTDDQSQMLTHPICPAGSDATLASSYFATPWNYHQVTMSGGVCDASAAHWVNLAGAGYANPPFEWPLQDFWQKPTNSPRYPISAPTSNFIGLVWHYAEVPEPAGAVVGLQTVGPSLDLSY